MRVTRYEQQRTKAPGPESHGHRMFAVDPLQSLVPTIESRAANFPSLIFVRVYFREYQRESAGPAPSTSRRTAVALR